MSMEQINLVPQQETLSSRKQEIIRESGPAISNALDKAGIFKNILDRHNDQKAHE